MLAAVVVAFLQEQGKPVVLAAVVLVVMVLVQALLEPTVLAEAAEAAVVRHQAPLVTEGRVGMVLLS
jgi:hypothetical protein